MKRKVTMSVACLGLLMLWPVYGTAQNAQGDQAKSTTSTIQSGGKPVYKPPRRGAPGGRIGGGRRGPGDKTPVLPVITPDPARPTNRKSPAGAGEESKSRRVE